VIDFYYWPTPNGWKVAIMLEECGLEYRVIPVNIGRGDQFKPEFLAISPNNRMPAIVDYDADDGPVPVFESGAILIYLAERTGRFMPQTSRGRKETLEWLFWQVGNLGPMAGQLSHFVNYAPGDHRYSHKRYADEYNRCLGVLERRLSGREFILDEYSIADMASWPWVLITKPLVSRSTSSRTSRVGARRSSSSRPCRGGWTWGRTCADRHRRPTRNAGSCSIKLHEIYRSVPEGTHPGGIFGKRCLSPPRVTHDWALSQKISVDGSTQLGSSSVPAMIIVTSGMTSASSISADPHSGQKRR